jgi:hypothetical protein
MATRIKFVNGDVIDTNSDVSELAAQVSRMMKDGTLVAIEDRFGTDRRINPAHIVEIFQLSAASRRTMKPELQAIRDKLQEVAARVEPIAISAAPGNQIETIAYAIHNLVLATSDLTRQVDATS